MDYNNPEPPDSLSDEVRAWFLSVVGHFDLSPHEIELLVLSSEALDTWRSAYAAIQEHGLVYVDRFGAPRQRPEVAILRDARIAFARLSREMNLDDAAPEPPRPPAVRTRPR